ncbi:hypothetical protein DSOL_2377 [Desulfosporosinus metallidurans]|uniref:Uncharacterized protein n=1 Tax=Desulfosporosinus metallidurans TaxID=1888891 RepID=A0A1Q8QWI0_9FIRM|nr:hypothetical protein DSOL_2377 [Desulfosporosinus metallidurans]
MINYFNVILTQSQAEGQGLINLLALLLQNKSPDHSKLGKGVVLTKEELFLRYHPFSMKRSPSIVLLNLAISPMSIRDLTG